MLASVSAMSCPAKHEKTAGYQSDQKNWSEKKKAAIFRRTSYNDSILFLLTKSKKQLLFSIYCKGETL